MMVGDRASLWLTLPALVIVGREIVVSALREWMAEMNRRGIVAVSRLGKVKTGVQIAAILTLLAFPPGSDPRLVMLGYVLIYLAAIMTLGSMVMYLRAAWPTLRAGLDARLSAVPAAEYDRVESAALSRLGGRVVMPATATRVTSVRFRSQPPLSAAPGWRNW